MESLTTNITLAELCRKYNLKPDVFYGWKQKFIEGDKMALTGSGAKHFSLYPSNRDPDKR